MKDDCPLCRQDGGTLLWRGSRLRAVDAGDADYPGYTRLIWNEHVAEMTDLDEPARAELMQAVWTVERLQREELAPDKVNLASLGNMVPHLHWHIIPRWRGDRHFPDAIWAPARSGAEPAAREPRLAEAAARLDRYHRRLAEALAALAAL